MRPHLGLYLLAFSILLLALFASLPSSHVRSRKRRGALSARGFLPQRWLRVSPRERELTAINPGETFTITSAVFNAHSSENPILPPFLMVDFGGGYGSWKQQGDFN